MPQVKVTRPQVKKILEQAGWVVLDLFETGKDPNHYRTAMVQVEINDPSEIDSLLPKVFREFSGHTNFSMAIWEEDEE